jgi:hypothetical protein
MANDNEIKEMDLEDLIAQTEQKILNNEYYEDVDVYYKDGVIHTRIRPISQARFIELSKNKKALENAEFNTLLIHECVLNKYDNKPFTIEQINKLFSGGLAAAITLKCIEVSGISLNQTQLNQLVNF